MRDFNYFWFDFEILVFKFCREITPPPRQKKYDFYTTSSDKNVCCVTLCRWYEDEVNKQ